MPVTRIQIRQATYLTWSKDGVKTLDTAVDEIRERSGELLRISSIVDYILRVNNRDKPDKSPTPIKKIIGYMWPDRVHELKVVEISPVKRTFKIGLLTITEEGEPITEEDDAQV